MAASTVHSYSSSSSRIRVTAAAASVLVIAHVLRRRNRRKKRRNRRVWTRQWILNREYQGAFHQLMQEIRLCDTSSYRNFVRMDAATFEELLAHVAPRITYQDTRMRPAIPPAERLAITLRFLATGMNYFNCFFLQSTSFIVVVLLQESHFRVSSICIVSLPRQLAKSYRRHVRQ